MNTRSNLQLRLTLSAVLLCTIALTAGCTTASTQPLAKVTSTPVKTGDPKIQEELRQLDHFLDAYQYTTFEAELRQNLERWDDADFQQKFPEWKKLTLDRPALPDALKTEKLFLLHRSLAHMSGNLPLEARHLQQLDAFLEDNPAIQDALQNDPSLLISMNFTIKHPALAAFFDKHPDLYTVFAQNAGAQAAL